MPVIFLEKEENSGGFRNTKVVRLEVGWTFCFLQEMRRSDFLHAKLAVVLVRAQLSVTDGRNSNKHDSNAVKKGPW
ncbi:hypothetical protein RRF57_010324 [Xylaria bambusicola]|uniref:Uncharacterized protein n=1 Tax=Xylaria bambusicola TaxID=326684 RepID=A0AAN7ZCK7_9PEZI